MAIIDKTTGKANLEVFAETLETLAKEDKNIVVVTSDSRGSGKLTPFGQQCPKQIIEVGIAEQNLVGVAAGLASTGKKVFAVKMAVFSIKIESFPAKIEVKLSGSEPSKVYRISAPAM